MLLRINGKFTTKKFKSLLLKSFRSMYEVDLAALDAFFSSSSGRQSKYSINLELFNEKIPSILLHSRNALATFFFHFLLTCVKY
jgi:hypothetical protein